jgi:hypothetical protein
MKTAVDYSSSSLAWLIAVLRSGTRCKVLRALGDADTVPALGCRGTRRRIFLYVAVISVLAWMARLQRALSRALLFGCGRCLRNLRAAVWQLGTND